MPVFKSFIIRFCPILIIILAAVTLFFGFGSRTFWMDETAVLEYYAKTPSSIDFLTEYFRVPDNHPPLYYLLVIMVYNLFPAGELGIRLVSILSGLGIVVTVYYFSLLLFGDKRIALFSMLLASVSSYFVLISQMARYHSLSALLMLLALYYFARLAMFGYSRRDLIWYIVFGVLVCWSDYPHFFYLVALSNIYYFYRWWCGHQIIKFYRWVTSQLCYILALLPMAWLVYHRIAVQHDGGFEKVSLLGHSLADWVTDLSMHFYAFFFGENILPWNWLIFGVGVLVLVFLAVYLIIKLIRREHQPDGLLLMYFFFGAVILNTVFMNYADPRYNFIVIPKYGFVAFPFFAMFLAWLVMQLQNRYLRLSVIGLILAVQIVGLMNFYGLRNYLNASYFRDFKSFEFVRDNARAGDKLILTGDANIGVYKFYQKKYFVDLSPVDLKNIGSVSTGTRAWFFATASDDGGQNVAAQSKVPAGFRVLLVFEDVPLDTTLKYYKEKILQRPSYVHKYGVYLLVKE